MAKRMKMTGVFLCAFLMIMMTACGEQKQIDSDADTQTESSMDTSFENATEDTNHQTEERKLTGIDLYGTYNQNDLLIVGLEETYSNITVTIPQIDGLKDLSVQEKINKDIYARTKDLYNNFTSIEYANFYVVGNFSNVISLGVFAGAEETSEQLYLNYNLVNGEPIVFEELFLEDADILQITRSAFYEMLVKDQYMENAEESVISPDENELYKIVKGFSESEEKVFAFSPAEILFYYKDSVAAVKMQDIAKDVAIYSKYETEESLYTRDDIGKKDIFTCVDLPEGLFEIFEFGYLEENLWYDVTIWEDYLEEVLEQTKLEKYKVFAEQLRDRVYDNIEAYRKLAKENPDRFYIILAKPYISLESDSVWNGETWTEIYSDYGRACENTQIFEMSRETYEEIYKDKIIDAYRYKYLAMQGGVMLDAEAADDVILKELTDEVYYNYMTGEEVQ